MSAFYTIPAIPKNWVHTWLKPFYSWLATNVFFPILAAGASSPTGYTGSGANWMYADGTNPVLFPQIRFVDQTTGLPVKFGITGGTPGVIS